MKRRPATLLIRPQVGGVLELWTHRLLGGACAGAFLLVLLRQLPGLVLWEEAGWPEAVLLVAAMGATLSWMARRVSLQNALTAAGVVGLIGGLAHWASYVVGIPLGPLRFPQAYGTTPFQEWFFVPVVLWVIVLLNARGVARRLLGPWCTHRHHGLHLLVLSALLVVSMAMGLEPFASGVKRYWLWGETRLPVTWERVPVSALFGWGVVSVIASVAATPFLINKHPQPGPPPREPLWIWAMLGTALAVGTAAAGLWAACGAAAFNGLLALILAAGTARRASDRRR